jgi:transposase
VHFALRDLMKPACMFVQAAFALPPGMFGQDAVPAIKAEVTINRRREGRRATRHIGDKLYRTHGLHFFSFGGGSDAWKECSVMDAKLQFVARRLAGEPMAELCREFGSSRKTGYQILDRYQARGIQGLTDRSRRPYRYAHQLPFQVENFILNVKREHASWGARKIRERLIRRFSGIHIPAKSTIHAVLDRHGLVERRGRLRRRAQGTALSLGQTPNELWCTDYKGEFLLGNRQYCYPPTVTDHAGCFLLTCEALSSTREDYAFSVFERLFKERGLSAPHPQRQRCALRFRARVIQPQQVGGVVVALGHWHRADQAGPSAAKWSP